MRMSFTHFICRQPQNRKEMAAITRNSHHPSRIRCLLSSSLTSGEAFKLKTLLIVKVYAMYIKYAPAQNGPAEVLERFSSDMPDISWTKVLDFNMKTPVLLVVHILSVVLLLFCGLVDDP
ncbi:uncharacterized protein [Physcomitrium patens]|uniref:uncharacterized protein isoform X2 n=1 Tax=Physcomitrium patens TaxID=3218 RepID=UPI003CCDE6CD